METSPTLPWEIVVVDNASGDDTPDVVSAFARLASVPVRYLVEKRPGLSWARNAGVRASHGDILAFTDDDCLVAPHWLERIDAEFHADAELAVVGGRVELHDARDRPVGVRVHPHRVMVQSLQDIVTFMIGCNMSCRRRVFTAVGDFDVRLGSGTRIPSAEDWDFLYRAQAMSVKILYVPEVVVFHAHGRRTDAEIDALRRGYAIGRWAFYCKHAARFDRHLARSATDDLSWRVNELVRRRRPGTLGPVALGVAYWLASLLKRRETSFS
jgi:glycosyltransferase involved in cell wall biosynthesis